MFLFLCFFFSPLTFCAWVPVPDRMFVLLSSRLRTTAHVICFLFSFSGRGFPLQSWQAGASGPEGWWLRGAEQCSCAHGWHSVPSHQWRCKRCPVPGKAEEQGGRGCLKELFLLENMTERVQQGGKAQSPAAETVGGGWKLKQHSGCGWTEEFGIVTMADWDTAGFKEVCNVVCAYRSVLSYPRSLSGFSVPDNKA